MVSLNDAISKAKSLSQLVIKVSYFNGSIEYYVLPSIPDKNEYIPDGYDGDVLLVADFSINK
jgi:hypothetical protein